MKIIINTIMKTINMEAMLIYCIDQHMAIRSSKHWPKLTPTFVRSSVEIKMSPMCVVCFESWGTPKSRDFHHDQS